MESVSDIGADAFAERGVEPEDPDVVPLSVSPFSGHGRFVL